MSNLVVRGYGFRRTGIVQRPNVTVQLPLQIIGGVLEPVGVELGVVEMESVVVAERYDRIEVEIEPDPIDEEVEDAGPSGS